MMLLRRRLLEGCGANRFLAALRASERGTATSSSSSAAAPTSSGEPRPLSEMPGLPDLPLVGSLPTLMMRKDFSREKIHEVMIDYAKKMGPIFKMKFPGMPKMVVLTDPDDVRTMYRTTMTNPVRIGFYSLKKVRDDAVDDYFHKKGGILIENGEEWWRVRSKVQGPMMKPKNLVRFLPEMDRISLEFMDIISGYQTKLGEMPENFLEEMYRWALESVGLVALNRRLGCLDPDLPQGSTQLELIKTVNVMFECLNITELGFPIWKVFPTPTYRKLEKAHNLFLSIIDNNIKNTEQKLLEKKSETSDLTLMEILLKTDGLSRKDVVTMILDMFFAGIDTTSHTLGFALYLLARNPAAQERLHAEVDSVLGDGEEEAITEHHLAGMSYLKQCIKETLRIFPLILGNARQLQKDEVFGGYTVPKGTQVVTMGPYTSMDESLFPRANEFLPERWDRSKPYGPIHPFASLPFSHGTRMCIGRRIAEQEIFVFLARAMHRFRVEYKYDDVTLINKMVAKPSEPLRFQFIGRKN